MRFSVVIPAYNAEATVGRAVQSALGAGASSVLVVDDGSSDDTGLVAEQAGAAVLYQKNAGAAAARRNGVASLAVPAAIVLDADDILVKAGVARAVTELARQSPSVVAIVSCFQDFSSSGLSGVSKTWPEGVSVRSLYERGHSPAPPGAILWRTSALKELYSNDPPGLWPRYAEDYELLLRGALIGQIVSLREVACLYSRDGGKSALNPERSISAAHEIRRHYAHLVDVPVRELSFLRRASLTLRKKSSSFANNRFKPVRILLLALAALLDPYYLRASIQRVSAARTSTTQHTERGIT